TRCLQRLREIADRTADQMIEQRDRDVIEEQARDRFVHAAPLLERADGADPYGTRARAAKQRNERADPAWGARDHRSAKHRGKPAEHERAFAADDEKS